MPTAPQGASPEAGLGLGGSDGKAEGASGAEGVISHAASAEVPILAEHRAAEFSPLVGAAAVGADAGADTATTAGIVACPAAHSAGMGMASGAASPASGEMRERDNQSGPTASREAGYACSTAITAAVAGAADPQPPPPARTPASEQGQKSAPAPDSGSLEGVASLRTDVVDAAGAASSASGEMREGSGPITAAGACRELQSSRVPASREAGFAPLAATATSVSPPVPDVAPQKVSAPKVSGMTKFRFLPSMFFQA